MWKHWITTVFGFVAAGAMAYGQYSTGHLDANSILMDLSVLGIGAASKDVNKQ